MSYEELQQMVDEIGLPSAYYQFPQKTEQAPPYICFYYPASADKIADNINYVEAVQVVIELYVNDKDFDLERKLEKVLRSHELPYTRTESYLDSERMYLETYTMEVIINADDTDTE